MVKSSLYPNRASSARSDDPTGGCLMDLACRGFQPLGGFPLRPLRSNLRSLAANYTIGATCSDLGLIVFCFKKCGSLSSSHREKGWVLFKVTVVLQDTLFIGFPVTGAALSISIFQGSACRTCGRSQLAHTCTPLQVISGPPRNWKHQELE